MYRKFRYFVYFCLFVFIFLPIICLFFSTFFHNLRPTDPSSLWNFILFSFDQRIIKVFFKSMSIGVFTSVLSGIVGLILALLLECSNLSHKEIFKFLLFTPFLIPPYIFTFSWLAFLGKRGTSSSMVFPNFPLNIYNPLAVAIFLFLSFFPISMFVISLGLKNMDKNLVDAGRLSNRKKVVSKIVIPLIKTHILISCFFVFVLTISEYTVPAFLRVNTYSDEVFAQLAAFYNLRRAMIYSFPLIFLALFVSGTLSLYFKKKSFTTISTFSRQKKEFIKLSMYQKIMSYFLIFLLIFLSLLVPVAILIIESKLSFLSAIILAKKSILNSLLTGIIGAMTITTFGFFTYYFLKKSRFLISVISFPLAIASPVIGISLINLYNNLPLPIYGTTLMVLLGHLLRFLPFSVFIFSAFLPQLSQSLEESARMSGSSVFKNIQKIVMPLTKGGFISSFIIIFIFCLGEIGVTQMISPPGFQTMPMRIETLMHYGNYPYVSSLSLLMLSFIFVLYTLYWWVYRKYD